MYIYIYINLQYPSIQALKFSGWFRHLVLPVPKPLCFCEDLWLLKYPTYGTISCSTWRGIKRGYDMSLCVGVLVKTLGVSSFKSCRNWGSEIIQKAQGTGLRRKAEMRQKWWKHWTSVDKSTRIDTWKMPIVWFFGVVRVPTFWFFKVRWCSLETVSTNQNLHLTQWDSKTIKHMYYTPWKMVEDKPFLLGFGHFSGAIYVKLREGISKKRTPSRSTHKLNPDRPFNKMISPPRRVWTRSEIFCGGTIPLAAENNSYAQAFSLHVPSDE